MADNPGGSPPDLSVSSAAWDELRGALARDVDRVADRLRGLSQARLAADASPHASRAEAARAAAQALADASAGLEAGPDSDPPTWRALPRLDVFAIGDQVAVTGHDLVAAAASAQPHDEVWTRNDRRTAHVVLAAAVAALVALRHAL